MDHIRTTYEDLYAALKHRYVTVLLDLPVNQPLEASHRLAMAEVRQNAETILKER